MGRRVLVVGGGGREHALAWRLATEDGIDAVLVAPGNPGMRDVATVLPAVPLTDAAAIVAVAREQAADLVVVGPEAPLVAGLADRLADAGIAVFGPSAAAARLEGSKAFCREIAEAAGVPMAQGRAFTDPGAAIGFAASLGGRVAVKADGLAAGKGVTVCTSVAAAEAAIREAMVEGVFGAAGRMVVVEEVLTGPEASVIAICDTTTCLALPAARDHKRIGEGDTGPNTGGMGAFSPLPDLGDAATAAVVARFHAPVVAELARRGTPFRGALFAGLMLTPDGPRLLEFNVRFGDPETEALLPRLAVPLGRLLAAAAEDRLAEEAEALGITGGLLPVRPGATTAVVLAAAGYPGAVRSGDPIEGVADARADGALVFAAGVAEAPADAGAPGALRTNGGRVLVVVGEGPDAAAAADAAYRAADRITFAGRQLRRDIGRAPATLTPGAAA
ncbi:MAG: phosphoribosylamine--glycine ligase [Chloroflexota bacterium]